MRELEGLPPDQIDELEAWYLIQHENIEEMKLAANANAGLQDVKQGMRR